MTQQAGAAAISRGNRPFMRKVYRQIALAHMQVRGRRPALPPLKLSLSAVKHIEDAVRARLCLPSDPDSSRVIQSFLGYAKFFIGLE